MKNIRRSSKKKKTVEQMLEEMLNEMAQEGLSFPQRFTVERLRQCEIERKFKYFRDKQQILASALLTRSTVNTKYTELICIWVRPKHRCAGIGENLFKSFVSRHHRDTMIFQFVDSPEVAKCLRWLGFKEVEDWEDNKVYAGLLNHADYKPRKSARLFMFKPSSS